MTKKVKIVVGLIVGAVGFVSAVYGLYDPIFIEKHASILTQLEQEHEDVTARLKNLIMKKDKHGRILYLVDYRKGIQDEEIQENCKKVLPNLKKGLWMECLFTANKTVTSMGGGNYPNERIVREIAQQLYTITTPQHPLLTRLKEEIAALENLDVDSHIQAINDATNEIESLAEKKKELEISIPIERKYAEKGLISFLQ